MEEWLQIDASSLRGFQPNSMGNHNFTSNQPAQQVSLPVAEGVAPECLGRDQRLSLPITSIWEIK